MNELFVRAASISTTEVEAVRKPTQILLIEDDPDQQRLICDYLSRENMKVSVASRIEDVRRHLAADRLDLAILDLRLGLVDGLDLLRSMRAESDLPVIITTGQRRDEIDRVVGLEIGADDCLAKPFSLRELLARIRAILRRANPRDRRRKTAAGVLRFGSWQLDRCLRRLTVDDGSVLPLTKGEYTLLLAFLEAPRRTLSREHLLGATRVHEDAFDRSIDVQILRLRRKLEDNPSRPRIIQTERGLGYVFTLPVTEG